MARKRSTASCMLVKEMFVAARAVWFRTQQQQQLTRTQPETEGGTREAGRRPAAGRVALLAGGACGDVHNNAVAVALRAEQRDEI